MYQELEAQAPEGWFSQYDISVFYPEVQKIPEKGLYLEIGVYKGRSLWVASKAAKKSVALWGIDKLPDPKIPNTLYIRRSSLNTLWLRPIDLLFIDGNHTYKFVRKEIEKYSPYVKKGGVILFHDYEPDMPGVYPAVNKWAKKNGLTVQTFKKTNGNTSIAKVQL